jgi:F-type H+-transporting ATPase subunit delta
MSVEKISRRYARALYMTAQEHAALPALVADTVVIREIYATVPELREALTSPKLSSRQKQEAVQTVFFGRISDSTLAFLQFLGHKNRLPFLAEVFAAVNTLYREAKGLVGAQVVSARSFGQAEKDDLLRHLNRRTGKTVNLEYREDAALLGGFKVTFPDFVLDCSARHQLETLKQALIAG